MLVVGIRRRLATPFLISLNVAEVGDLHYDGVEWTSETRRERVLRAGDGETPSTSIAGTQSRSTTEGELADRCRVTTRGVDTACLKCPTSRRVAPTICVTLPTGMVAATVVCE